jgi:hypothetical protein
MLRNSFDTGQRSGQSEMNGNPMRPEVSANLAGHGEAASLAQTRTNPARPKAAANSSLLAYSSIWPGAGANPTRPGTSWEVMAGGRLAPQWCPRGLSKTQRRRLQKMRQREIAERKEEEEQDRWFVIVG